mmetsp:Transcript_29320/g.69623  ORF Transcript_29320/g.69623 Transcript_29320/m.69623 type:complete len:531 (+) Transcript_29320:152-1744(+)
MEESNSQGSHRRARQTAVAAIGGCLLVASVVSFCRAPAKTLDAVVGGRVDLLSVDKSDAGKEAAKLRVVHTAYDKAKQRLQQLSVQYGRMGERLEEAESNAAALREELEERMGKIEHDFGLAHPPQMPSAETVTLAAIPKAEQQSHRVAEPSAPRSPLPTQSDGAPVRSVRAAGTQFVASLTQLQEVQKQLEDENKKICELCGSSSLLRINRRHTCARCATSEASGGDTDIESFLENAAASRQQSEGSDTGGSEDAESNKEEARRIPTIKLASREMGVRKTPSATTIIDSLFGAQPNGAASAPQNAMATERSTKEDEEWNSRPIMQFPPYAPAAHRSQAEQMPREDGPAKRTSEEEWNTRPITQFPPYAPAAHRSQTKEKMPRAEEGGEGGHSLLAALGLFGAGGGGSRDQSVRAPRSRSVLGGAPSSRSDLYGVPRALRNDARNSELMEVDRGDAGEKIGSRGAEGAIGAWYNAGREQRFLLGVCWPTRAEEASVSLCGTCAKSLGRDVTSLGSAVSCSPYHPAEGKGR